MVTPTAKGGAGFLLIVVVLILQLAVYWPALVPAPSAAAGAPDEHRVDGNIALKSTSAAARRYSNRGSERADGPFFDEEQDDDAMPSALARDASSRLAADNAANGSVRPRTNQTAARREPDGDGYYYAPIVVGAGQGTTGTHLVAEVTCHLGFPSFHYAIGCLPKPALVLAGPGNVPSSTCNPKIIDIGEPYVNLTRAHWKLTRSMLQKSRESSEWGTETLYNRSITGLEDIIIWGKENKVKRSLKELARSRPC